MNSFKLLLATAATTLLLTSAAQAESGVQLGQLNCEVEGGTGFIFGSSKNMACTFTPANNEITPETYVGKIDKYGIDIGVTGRAVILWTVIAAEADKYAPGSLSGTYSGASAEASFAVGLGANVLVGGGSNSFALQPFSVSAGEGVNVAVGFSQVTLAK